ncbi:MAG: VOC family protein [Gaiellales bacterium]|nr:VOC family protein [Gaiellales bacterium]
MVNPIVHWDLIVSDAKKAKAFYGALFDWRFDESTFPGYTVIDVGEEGRGGGMMQRPADAPGCSLNTYFGVDDIDGTLAKAVERGATVLVAKTEITGIGYWAMFLDPDGIPMSLFEPVSQA